MIAHIYSVDDCMADSLSAFQLHHFQTLALKAQPFPDPICVWPYQACFQPIHLRVALSTYWTYTTGANAYIQFGPKLNITCTPYPAFSRTHKCEVLIWLSGDVSPFYSLVLTSPSVLHTNPARYTLFEWTPLQRHAYVGQLEVSNAFKVTPLAQGCTSLKQQFHISNFFMCWTAPPMGNIHNYLLHISTHEWTHQLNQQ